MPLLPIQLAAVRWTPNGGAPATRFRSVVESIPAWHERLRNVVILCRDAFEVIGKIEDAGHSAVYIDPPYMSESRTSGAYRHDFEDGFMGNDGDHERLAKELSRFKSASVVVSYYDCPRVRDLYDGWMFIDKSRGKNLSSAGGRGERKSEASEVLIVNVSPSTRATT